MATAIITGASRGFGRALAADLLDDGWQVVIDARNADDLHVTAAQLTSNHPNGTLVALAGSVGDEWHRNALISAADELGGIDLLVNNASLLGPSPQPALADYPLDVFAEVYAVNAIAPLALTQLALPALRRSHGTIVNITSDASVEAYEGWGGYGSSKAALDHWTRILANEEPTVHVYVFDPGDMRTQMHQEAFPGEDISDRPLPETVVPALRRLLAVRPASGRHRASDFANPDDLAGVGR